MFELLAPLDLETLALLLDDEEELNLLAFVVEFEECLAIEPAPRPPVTPRIKEADVVRVAELAGCGLIGSAFTSAVLEVLLAVGAGRV